MDVVLSSGLAGPGVGLIRTESILSLDLLALGAASSTDEADALPEQAIAQPISFEEISAAAYKIRNEILRTPCTRSGLSRMYGMDIWFKKEYDQYTGSFKERGARNMLLSISPSQKALGVIAESAGNHALALAYHGQLLDINVTVVMPKYVPIMKVQSCKVFGANVIVAGNDLGESKQIAVKLAKKLGMVYANGYDHPLVIAGSGTVGLEILEQVENVDAIIVPVGGGGVLAGVALAVKSLNPSIKIIGVEPERCASFTRALREGRPVKIDVQPTLADGLAMPMVGINAFATARNLVDKVVTVGEEAIALAILRLVEQEKAIVEGAGAVGMAAILSDKLPELKNKRVVVVLCGGNIDTAILGRCLERGLAADGRLVAFQVLVPDSCTAIADLTGHISDLGVSIKDLMHEMASIKSDVFQVVVKVVCETRDLEQALKLECRLREHYKILSWDLPSV